MIVTAGTEEQAAPLPADDTTEGGGPESADPATGWSAGYGLPPKGTALSTPISGKPIARFGEYRHKAFVYADGRVLWFATGSPIMEGRLTPKGVELLRLELRSGKYAREVRVRRSSLEATGRGVDEPRDRAIRLGEIRDLFLRRRSLPGRGAAPDIGTGSPSDCKEERDHRSARRHRLS